jgi:hypothetical protein
MGKKERYPTENWLNYPSYRDLWHSNIISLWEVMVALYEHEALLAKQLIDWCVPITVH